MRFASLVTAVILAAVPAFAVTAYSGSSCDGSAGADAPCDGSCHSFAGRHSFRVGLGGGACVSVWSDSSCGGQRYDYPNQADQCTNVNTGWGVNSFRCWYSGCH